LKSIDLNVDVGEGDGFDEPLLDLATSANVCCGQHAGSDSLTGKTVDLCIEKGVRIGIHPGYPDRKSKGRAALLIENQRDYLSSVMNQIRTFMIHYPAEYVKPHGAFYNDLAVPLVLGWDSLVKYPTAKSPYEAGGQALSLVPGSGALQMSLRIYKLPLMGLANTMLEEIAKRAEVPFIREGFADRRYTQSGTLVPRSEPNSILSDRGEIRDQVLELAEKCDSICVHGDTLEAAEILTFVVKILSDANIAISASRVE